MSHLPEQFSELEPWSERWCLTDSNARSHARVSAAMIDIEGFYNAAITHAERALGFLADKQLGDLTPEEENLLKLLLSLAEIGPAVEWFGQPRVIDGYEETKFPLVLPLSDTAAQGLK